LHAWSWLDGIFSNCPFIIREWNGAPVSMENLNTLENFVETSSQHWFRSFLAQVNLTELFCESQRWLKIWVNGTYLWRCSVWVGGKAWVRIARLAYQRKFQRFITVYRSLQFPHYNLLRGLAIMYQITWSSENYKHCKRVATHTYPYLFFNILNAFFLWV